MYLHSAYLKVQALHSCEILGNADPATQHNMVTEDLNPRWHCCGNLKSRMIWVLFDYYSFLLEAALSEPDSLYMHTCSAA